MWAAYYGHTSAVEALLAHRPDIALTDKSEATEKGQREPLTALDIAREQGHSCSWLLEAASRGQWPVPATGAAMAGDK